MGQYYKAVILAEKTEVKEFIRTWLDSYWYSEGCKLIEHAYLDSVFVRTVEYLLSKDGMFYKSRLVWAGDYADKEPSSDKNLYKSIDEYSNESYVKPSEKTYRYIINHTTCQYVDKEKSKAYHPLPLLTAEGNGRGGGDYSGSSEELVGSWARHILSVTNTEPSSEFTELECNFGH